MHLKFEVCNKATVGGILKNEKWRIDLASVTSIIDVPILVAECMVVGIEVRLARTRKVRNIKVENDATQVVKAINREMYCFDLNLGSWGCGKE